MTNTVAAPIIGKVTERKGARNHLVIDGRAHCGAGRGVIAEATRREVNGDTPAESVCRRSCRKALRAALAELVASFATALGAMSPAEAAARDAAALFATPTELAARQAEIAEGILRFHRERREAADAEAARIAAGSWDHRERLLAELAAMPLPPGFEDLAA